jgi:CDP-diacylglycerol--glycerol-3-phosphate 3-phosphatidyltransferase/cardiolipin synthase
LVFYLNGSWWVYLSNIMTLATWITVFRLLLVPIFAACLLASGQEGLSEVDRGQYRMGALAVFLSAAVSDALDGFVARRFGQISRLGALLDPLADKLLLITALVLLTFGPGWNGERLLWLVVALVLFRDAALLTALAYFRFRKIEVHIRPHWTGKLSTFLVMTTVVVVLAGSTGVGVTGLVVATGTCVLASTLVYLRQGWELLGKR